MDITWGNPEYFWLLLILIPLIGWYVWRGNRDYASMQVSSLREYGELPFTWRNYLRHSVFVLKIAALALLIVALARPQSSKSWADSTTFGIDIVIAQDVSSSMLAEDLKPNRLEAAKNVAKQFVSGRPYDRIGLVVFSGESFTQCPLTSDHAVLINLFRDVKCGIINDGTAIGLGLANAITRLRDSDGKSKVIILLTDGVNNQGDIDPQTAAQIAQKYNIRVYTIGMGTQGMAPYPFDTPYGKQYQNVPVEIDESLLKEIARTTGGAYYRAESTTKLQAIYQKIDKLEKSKVEIQQFSKKNEEFLPYVLVAAALMFLSLLLKYTIFRNIP
jgi:Ca-activated chloride channel family protein